MTSAVAPTDPINSSNLLPVVQAALGQGAYEIDSSDSYGSGVTDDSVDTLVYGALKSSNFTLIDGLESATTFMESFLSKIPVNILEYLKPFIPGATSADFSDSTTAAEFIVNSFVPSGVTNTLTWIARLVNDLKVLFDVFHLTYQAGTSADVPGTLGTNGQPTWYSAWNDLMELCGLSTGGSTAVDSAPTFGSVITQTQTWLNQVLQIFDDQVVTPINDEISALYTWWQGIATFQTNSTDTQTNLQDWIGTFIECVIVLVDFLHVTYQAGSSGDTWGTLGTNGKPTWYSAWNELRTLFGVVQSTTAPTDAAPTIGQAVTTAQSAATTASTNAQAALNAPVTGVTGSTATSASSTDAANAIASLQQQLSTTTQLANSLIPASTGGINVSDSGQYPASSSTWGTGWTISGTAVAARDATYGFTLTPSGSTARSKTGLYNTQLKTDYQSVTLLFNRASANVAGCKNRLILRSDSAGANYVFCDVTYQGWNGTAQFGYRSAGVDTMLGTATTIYMGFGGGSYTFNAGDYPSSNLYLFTLVSTVGNGVVASYTDSAHATSYGSTLRYPGQAMFSAVSITERVPAATSFTARDTGPLAVQPGSAFYSQGSGSNSIPSLASGVYTPIWSWFNVQGYKADDITVPASGTGGFSYTVSLPGLYVLSFACSVSGSVAVYAGVQVNGVDIAYSGGMTYGPYSFQLALNAGDVVTPVWNIQTSGSTGSFGRWAGTTPGASFNWVAIRKIGV